MAVANLGETTPVNSITSPATKAEKLGQLFFDTTRDRVLAKNGWSFARRYAALVDVTTTEARDDWSFAYELPSDSLRVLAIDVGRFPVDFPAFEPGVSDNLAPSWEISLSADGTKRLLFCDVGEASVAYTARVTDLSLWDLDAIETLSWFLAAKMAMPLTSKPDLAQMAEKMARQTALESVADDANEAKPDRQPDSEYIRARSGC